MRSSQRSATKRWQTCACLSSTGCRIYTLDLCLFRSGISPVECAGLSLFTCATSVSSYPLSTMVTIQLCVFLEDQACTSSGKYKHSPLEYVFEYISKPHRSVNLLRVCTRLCSRERVR
eukprot:2223490-Amphidinium_carterae.1